MGDYRIFFFQYTAACLLLSNGWRSKNLFADFFLDSRRNPAKGVKFFSLRSKTAGCSKDAGRSEEQTVDVERMRNIGIEPDEIIEDFMGDNLRAESLRSMRETLTDRLNDLKRQLKEETAADNIAGLQKRVKQLKEQIRALEQEEIVSEFVENSIRATLSRPTPIARLVQEIEE